MPGISASRESPASSREARLLLALWITPDEARLSGMRALIEPPLDWETAVRAAQSHHLLPLLAHNLKALPADLVPASVLSTLNLHELAVRRKNALFAAELARLTDRFREGGIEVIAYKGPVLAELCYGDLNLRSFGDIDFLVRSEHLPEVCRVLEQDGYHWKRPPTEELRAHIEREFKEYCFVRDPIIVEPHWSITARRFPFPIDYEALWARSEIHALFGTHIRLFAPEDLLLILCVCGAKGKWKRAQMIYDVAAALTSLRNLDAGVCLARARETGTERILLLGCHLAHELLGVPVPGPLLQRMRRDRTLPVLTRSLLSTTLQVSPSPAAGAQNFPWRFSPLIMAMRERPLDKARYLLRTTTTPTALHLQRMPLPSGLRGLYRLLVPLHDYLLQPTWRYALAALGRVGLRRRA